MRKDLNNEEIKRLYLDEKKNTYEIAKILKCGSATIHQRLKKLKIKRPQIRINLDEKEIKRLYLEEYRSFQEISEMFNCLPFTITRRLKNIGVISRGNKLPFLDDEKIKGLYLNKNKSCCEISRILNVAPVTIINRLNKLNISTPIERFRIKKEQIKELYLSGESSYSISKILKCTPTTILRILREEGIKRRDDREKTLNYLKRHTHPGKVNLEKFKEEIIGSYEYGHSTDYISNRFGVGGGVISKRLKEWGIKIRHEIFGSRRKASQRVTKDGHIVKSTYEMEIDDWLFHNKIIHVYNKMIGSGRFRTDFYIPDANIWIEFFGLMDVKSYRERTKKKVEAYKQLGLNLLPIFPKDDIQKKLNFLLQYSQNQTKLKEFAT